MASQRRTWTVGLMLGLACHLPGAQAQQPASGVSVLWLSPTRSESTADVEARCRKAVTEALTSVVGQACRVDSAPDDWQSLLDDLRTLPARVQAQATLTQRFALLVRLDGKTGERTRGEAVLVDRTAPTLLGYTRFDVLTEHVAAEVSSALATFTTQSLPAGVVRDNVAATRGKPTPTSAEGVAHAASSAAVRPQPAPEPDPGRDSPAQPLLSEAPVGNRSVAAILPASTHKLRPGAGASQADALLRAYCGSGLAVCTLGTAAARPRVYEAAWQTLLLPAPDKGGRIDPHAAPVKAVLTVYSTDDDIQVDARFSRPVAVTTANDGGWALWDVNGYQAEQEQTADLGAAGFITVRARPGDAPGTTRFGCRLRAGAGDAKMEVKDGGRLVSLSLPKLNGTESDGVGALPGGLAAIAGVSDTFEGSASWYGSDWHGRLTANGERFNMYALTAAHKSLPLGSWCRVTNLANGKSVIVRINDRGPYAGGRILDLSYAAAVSLDFVGEGVTRVHVDVLDLKH